MFESITAMLMGTVKEFWYKFLQYITGSGKLLGTEKYTLMKYDENKNIVKRGTNVQVPNISWFKGTKFCMDPDSNEESLYRLLTIETTRFAHTDSLDIMMEMFTFTNNLKDDMVVCTANYLQGKVANISTTTTTLQFMTFQVLAGSGKYKNARIVIFNYDNNSPLKPRVMSIFS